MRGQRRSAVAQLVGDALDLRPERTGLQPRMELVPCRRQRSAERVDLGGDFRTEQQHDRRQDQHQRQDHQAQCGPFRHRHRQPLPQRRRQPVQQHAHHHRAEHDQQQFGELPGQQGQTAQRHDDQDALGERPQRGGRTWGGGKHLGHPGKTKVCGRYGQRSARQAKSARRRRCRNHPGRSPGRPTTLRRFCKLACVNPKGEAASVLAKCRDCPAALPGSENAPSSVFSKSTMLTVV